MGGSQKLWCNLGTLKCEVPYIFYNQKGSIILSMTYIVVRALSIPRLSTEDDAWGTSALGL